MAIKKVKLKDKELSTARAIDAQINSALLQVGVLEDKKIGLLQRISGLRMELQKQREFLSQQFIEKGVQKVNIDIQSGEVTVITEDIKKEKPKGKKK